MAIDKIQSESINLADNFAFTGTVSGAGQNNAPYFHARLGSDQSVGYTGNTTKINTTNTNLINSIFDLFSSTQT